MGKLFTTRTWAWCLLIAFHIWDQNLCGTFFLFTNNQWAQVENVNLIYGWGWGSSRNWAVSAWASYHIRKIAGCACAGNAGNVFPRRRFQRETLVSDPGMHHGTCVTHVPWCMSGLLTCGDGENVPGIPGVCAPTILRIWQEAHGKAINW